MTKEEFIQQTVNGWIKKDLERMLQEIPAKSGEMGNINFPLALCTLAYMDSLGSFILGRSCTYEANICAYITNCFSHPNDYDPKVLRLLFRNGLVHEYFPLSPISRAGQRPPLFRTIVDGSEMVVLDAETLAQDFLESLPIFEQTLTDKAFQFRMQERSRKRIEMGKQAKRVIRRLPGLSQLNIPIRVSGSISVPISGASTVPGPVKFIPWDAERPNLSITTKEPRTTTTTFPPD